MTIREMAATVLNAKMMGDLRYQEFMQKLSERTGRSVEECEHITFMIAMGMQL